jgi:isopenicillin N synthase-like dioxygenase
MNDWFHGDEQTKTKFAQKWDHAFATSGFCTIINHGVPSEVMSDLYDAAKIFFNLSDEEKKQFRATKFLGPGYHEAGEENYNANKTDNNSFDMNHSFNFYSTPETVEKIVPEESAVHPVLYKVADKYWQSLFSLEKTLWSVSDRALNLPAGTFESFYTSHGTPYNCLRLADYFQLSEEQLSSPGAQRIGAHTDYMGYTILKCDDVPGLEVAVGEQDFNLTNLSPKFEQWIPVTPRKDAFVINAGDFFRFWTNGHWKSAFHQVTPQSQRRLSMVYFTGPGFDARTDLRFDCNACNGTNKYPDVSMDLKEYMEWRKKMASTGVVE